MGNDPQAARARRAGILSIIDSRRRLVRAFTRGRDELDYPPLFLWVETTSRCNLRCPMCPQSEGLKRERGDMPPERLERIASEAAGRVQLFSLHFGGEPLLHKRLPEMVETVSRRGITTLLHTNGTLAGAEAARGLIAAGLDHIVFSFDAVPREKYPEKRPPAEFDRTYSAIREFLEEKKRVKSRWPLVTIKTLLFYGQGELAAAAAEVRAMFAGLPVDNFTAEYAHSFSGAFADRITGEGRYPMRPRGGALGCALPWHGFSIGWDGTAYACCNDLNGERPIGNIDETGLMDIWNGAEMRRLRARLAEKKLSDLPLCAKCDSVHRGFSPREAVVEGVKFAAKYAVRPALFRRPKKT